MLTYSYKKFNRLVDISRALFHKPEGRFKHFTFILKGTKIISIGFNNVYKEATRINGKYYTYPYGGVHSEMDAVASLPNFSMIRRYTLVNIRLNNAKILQNSKPCNICLNNLLRFGFRRIFFSMPNGIVKLC